VAAECRQDAGGPGKPPKANHEVNDSQPSRRRPITTDEESELDLDELSSAEDFLDYFRLEYEPSVVHVNRLHILQRFHDYLAEVDEMPADASERWTLHKDLLGAAYRDFVGSDPITEKVFRVFHMHGQRTATVALAELVSQLGHAS
jgi:nitrogenase-stabilizing/protective protein